MPGAGSGLGQQPLDYHLGLLAFAFAEAVMPDVPGAQVGKLAKPVDTGLSPEAGQGSSAKAVCSATRAGTAFITAPWARRPREIQGPRTRPGICLLGQGPEALMRAAARGLARVVPGPQDLRAT